MMLVFFAVVLEAAIALYWILKYADLSRQADRLLDEARTERANLRLELRDAQLENNKLRLQLGLPWRLS